jgi:hypothetical protein
VIEGLHAVGDGERQVAGVDHGVAEGGARVGVVLHHQDVRVVAQVFHGRASLGAYPAADNGVDHGPWPSARCAI